MNKQAKGLGKGLGALLGKEPIVTGGVIEVPVTDISPNEHQPRRHFDKAKLEELTKSIREYGVIQPLVVIRRGAGYMLVAGERRLRAAKDAGLTQVPVLVREYDDPARAAIALIENIQREDLDPVEEAAAYERLGKEFSLTQAEIAQKVGRSRSYITNMLRLLRLPEWIREQLRLRTLNIGQVRPLVGMHDPDEQRALAERILKEGWNARQVEMAVEAKKTESASKTGNTAKRNAKPSRKQDATAAYMAELTEKLKLELGTLVRIRYGQENQKLHGVIQIDFADVDELERLASYFEK